MKLIQWLFPGPHHLKYVICSKYRLKMCLIHCGDGNCAACREKKRNVFFIFCFCCFSRTRLRKSDVRPEQQLKGLFFPNS